MKKYDISKIHTSSNFILSISLLIMFDTLLRVLRPSLQCNNTLHFTILHPTTLHHTLPNYTSLHFATLHYTSPNCTSLHFTQLHFTTLRNTSPNYTSLHLSTLHFLSFTLHYPLIYLYAFTFPIVLYHLTSLHYTQYCSHLQTYFQNNEPLHCPKELLTISLHFTFYLATESQSKIIYKSATYTYTSIIRLNTEP
jgi:hypothetical protein